MALRSFTAPDGTAWRVWQVTPAAVLHAGPERRVRDRRGQDVILYRGPERRAGQRRRGGSVYAGVTPGLAGGWLAFEAEAGTAKRRLSPPPAGWEDLPAESLSALWEQAAPVRGYGEAASLPHP